MSDDAWGRTPWDPAPEGQILVPGGCRVVDGDGQGCARGVIHLMSDHQHTGLRTWLESSSERGIVRVYEADRADELEAMEAPLLARFDYAPIARQDYSRTEDGGLDSGWVLFFGWLAPTQKVTFSIRAVCYARPGSQALHDAR